MEQQPDVFTQKRIELMLDMATKKLQQQVDSMKESMRSLSGEINSLKSQISRLQFQQPSHPVQRTLVEAEDSHQTHVQQPALKKEVRIVDCRPEGEKKEEFRIGADRNSEPIRPRYGSYQPEDVSIEKFFYFGRK